MKGLLIMLFSIVLLMAEDIDLLLHDYEEASELSKKTKDESAGNLIVYTRDDLERMQVESLDDILKSLRFFPYMENRIANPDILNQDPMAYYSKSIRVYLNEHELLTAISGSGLIMFGNMEMDFIDHVEIYEGFPSMDFGIEPATIVIRLYSKTAEHDEGGRVKVKVGSYGSNKENVYYTNQEDGLSYFFYAGRNDDNKDSYEHQGETLRRDGLTNSFYGSLDLQNHGIELHVQEKTGDAFLGSLVGSTPHSSTQESKYINVATHSKFFNDSMSVNLSYMDSENSYESKYNNPVFIPDPSAPPPSVLRVSLYQQSIYEEAFTANIKQVWDLDIHTITVGAQYRYKHFDLTDVKFNTIAPPIHQAYYKENVYSFYIQDLIALNENNLITLSVMDQIYKRNTKVDEPNTLQLRFGYIFTNEEWVAKTFISKQEFASEPYMTISPYYGNTQLKPETYTSVFQEVIYAYARTTSKIVLGYGKNKNTPILNSNFQMQNSTKDIYAHLGAVEFTLNFNQKDKLELKADYTFIESPYVGGSSSTHYNYVARMLNTVSKFDIFNELVVHSGYSDVDTGYDYSAGIKYEFNKDLHVELKGVNIFNTGAEKSYVNQINPATSQVTDRVVVPIIERKFLIGMEYLF